MADFGWAYLSGAVTGIGPDKSIQYLTAADGELTGSSNFTFNTTDSKLFLTGTMVISGTIQANTFDVIHTGDSHTFTGSLNIVSGGMRNHYYKLTTASHTVASYDHIIGVSSSAYVSIQLPSASVAGVGRLLVIKDEFNATRASVNEIAVSASGTEKIDHAATYCISGDSAALTLYSDGISKWFIY